ncbi:MAG: carbohydrate kinase family protein [Frankiaceae bacterium]|nr:carbohydrate kinase family protein [Frankiaceae bacterium]
MRRLAVVGDLVEDVVVWPDGPVARGSDTPSRVFRSRGGSAANVAVAAAPLVSTRFLGCVGTDPLGDRLVAELAAAGVEVRAQRRGRTGTIVVLVDVDGERTFLPDRGAAADLGLVADDDLDDVSVLHVPAYGLHGGRTATTVRALLATATARGIPVSLDASSWAVLREIPDYVALVERVRPVVLFANADEARELPVPLTGTTVVVKNGSRPTTVLLPDGSSLSVPVPVVDAVRDSTGAGDAFAAGWLSAMMEGRDLPACVERAHALARLVLASPGAGPSRQEEPA